MVGFSKKDIERARSNYWKGRNIAGPVEEDERTLGERLVAQNKKMQKRFNPYK